MQRQARVIIWSLTALAAIAIAVFAVSRVMNQPETGKMGAGSPIGAPFTLTDHNGNPITEAALKGRPAMVFFGFTHCPDVCPTTLLETASWLDALGDAGKPIKAFFITVDPERDTPDVMRSYVENFSDRITGITGDPDKVAALADAWHVYRKKVQLDGGGYTMDHTASVFLVDSRGNFRGTIAYGENSETAIAKLRMLASQ